MDTIKKRRRVLAFKVDEESMTLLPDYLENIARDVYLSITEFAGDNYVHIREFYNDRDGYLRAKKEGIVLTMDQFAIFVDSTDQLESRYWAMEEELSVTPYEKFIGTWKLSVDVFGNLNVFKHNCDPATCNLQLMKKGISLPLVFYRSLAREIFILLERFQTLKERLPCYKSKHSSLAKCDVCDPFEKFRPKPDDAIYPIESLANNI